MTSTSTRITRNVTRTNIPTTSRAHGRPITEEAPTMTRITVDIPDDLTKIRLPENTAPPVIKWLGRALLAWWASGQVPKF
jgi:hypothetical protein